MFLVNKNISTFGELSQYALSLVYRPVFPSGSSRASTSPLSGASQTERHTLHPYQSLVVNRIELDRSTAYTCMSSLTETGAQKTQVWMWLLWWLWQCYNTIILTIHNMTISHILSLIFTFHSHKELITAFCGNAVCSPGYTLRTWRITEI